MILDLAERSSNNPGMNTKPMIATSRHALAVATAVLLVGTAGTALAQSAADKANAEQLFNEARQLMDQDRHAEACPKFEASNKLDPAVGTLLNLATCYEAVGKLASAWGIFREAEDRAKKEGQQKRVDYARGQATALEPRLPRLIIKAPDEDDVPGLVVKRDGSEVARVQFGSKIFVDPGPVTVTASAPGHLDFRKQVTAVESEEVVVQVPVLDKAPPGATPVTPGPVDGPVDGGGSGGSSRRLYGLIAGGTGVALLGISGGVGLSAKSKWDKAFDDNLCDGDQNICSPEGQALTDSARSRANIATGLAIAGIAVAAAGTYLFLSAPSGDEKVARVVPSAGPDSVGLAVIGSF